MVERPAPFRPRPVERSRPRLGGPDTDGQPCPRPGRLLLRACTWLRRRRACRAQAPARGRRGGRDADVRDDDRRPRRRGAVRDPVIHDGRASRLGRTALRTGGRTCGGSCGPHSRPADPLDERSDVEQGPVRDQRCAAGTRACAAPARTGPDDRLRSGADAEHPSTPVSGIPSARACAGHGRAPGGPGLDRASRAAAGRRAAGPGGTQLDVHGPGSGDRPHRAGARQASRSRADYDGARHRPRDDPGSGERPGRALGPPPRDPASCRGDGHPMALSSRRSPPACRW